MRKVRGVKRSVASFSQPCQDQGHSVFERNTDEDQCLSQLGCQLTLNFGDIAVPHPSQQLPMVV